jgi:hypothetical protein
MNNRKGSNLTSVSEKVSNLTDEEKLQNDIQRYDAEEEINIYRKEIKIREKIIFYEFLNFLEVYIHSIIYLSDVYPKETFTDYKLYNLPFLKFNIDDVVNDYISDFLKNIENLIFSRFINKIYILIIDADSSTILEMYSMECSFSQNFYTLNYEELCLNFKSILFKLFITGNKRITEKEKKILIPNQENFNKHSIDYNTQANKTFLLCLESNESKVLSNVKLYEEILNSFEENFVKNLFKNDMIKLFEKRELCAMIDDPNFSITISRNFI